MSAAKNGNLKGLFLSVFGVPFRQHPAMIPPLSVCLPHQLLCFIDGASFKADDLPGAELGKKRNIDIVPLMLFLFRGRLSEYMFSVQLPTLLNHE